MAEEQRRIIPVWFFVGVILLIYGVLILATGIAEFGNPPPTVLAEVHAPVWWGAILIVMGALFTYLFWPKKATSDVSEADDNGHSSSATSAVK
jgi:divalent metal cation (Fe/Co/Zn/Cd) transporter